MFLTKNRCNETINKTSRVHRNYKAKIILIVSEFFGLCLFNSEKERTIFQKYSQNDYISFKNDIAAGSPVNARRLSGV